MTEEAIFLAALEIAKSAQRARHLDNSCGTNAALRRRIENLLAAHEFPGDFLDVPAMEQMARSLTPSHDATSISGPSDDRQKGKSAPQGDLESKNAGELLAILEPSTIAGSLGRLDHYEIQDVIGKGGLPGVGATFLVVPVNLAVWQRLLQGCNAPHP